MQVSERMERELALKSDCVIPPVAYYEVKRGLLAINAFNRLELLNELCRALPVGDMTQPAWDLSARLYAARRQRGLPAGDADIFIAAFCLVGCYTLVTNNLRHFEQIDGLACVNWKE